jgi:hypothetical protein
MGGSRRRRIKDPSSLPPIIGKDCEPKTDQSAKDRRHDFESGEEVKPTPPPAKPARSKKEAPETEKEKRALFGKKSVEIHQPGPPTRLIGPTQSPRDPNHYR